MKGAEAMGGVLAHVFKERHLVKEMEETFCPT